MTSRNDNLINCHIVVFIKYMIIALLLCNYTLSWCGYI